MFTIEDAQLILETLELVESQLHESIGNLLVGETLRVEGIVRSATGTLSNLEKLMIEIREGK